MYSGLGAIYDNPTVTGVVELAQWAGDFVQVRLSASGANFGLNGPPEILDGLKQAVGYCVKVSGHFDNSMGGYQVEGWTLLTNASAGDVPYTSCADILKGAESVGQVPTTTAPPTGGGTQPAPSEGQASVAPVPSGGGSGAPGTTVGGLTGTWAVVGALGILGALLARKRQA